MAIGPWIPVDTFRPKLADEGVGTATWKLALFQSTSNLSAASTTYAGVTNEVANGNGYTTGGISVTLSVTGTTTVTIALSAVPEFTASGGNITGVYYAVLYEVGGDVAAYCLVDDTPAAVTIVNTFTLEITSTDVFNIS